MKKVFFLIISFLILLGGCKKKVEIDPQTAGQMIIHRNLGLAYLEENKLRDAEGEFQTLVEIAPFEPLGYANLGLTYLRIGKFEQAEKLLKEALNLESDHLEARFLLAELYRLTRRYNQAIRSLEKILDKQPYHVRTLYQLAQFYRDAKDPGSRQKAEDYLSKIVNTLPANVAARLTLVELLIRNGKHAEPLQHMETIRQTLPELPDVSVEIFKKSIEQLRQKNAGQALAPTLMFHNLLKPTSFYKAALANLKGRGGPITGEPVRRFSHAVSLHIRERTGIPDALHFTDVTTTSGLAIVSSTESEEFNDEYPPITLALADYDGDGDQDIFVSRLAPGKKFSRQFLFNNYNGFFTDTAGDAGIAHKGRDLAAQFADFDNDGYLDLFVTNSHADKLYQNRGKGAFGDVTTSAGLLTVSNGQAIVFADLDLEGDLDLFIASSSQNRLYRNNLDGTFLEIADEVGIAEGDIIRNSRDAGFGDFDDDGDIDIIVVNQDGGNQYYDNMRQSYFRNNTELSGLPTSGGSGAVTVGDYNNDGYLDLFVTDLGGKQHSLLLNIGDGSFERDTQSDSVFEAINKIAGFDAAFFDADNDGFLDLLVAGASLDSSRKNGGLWLFYNNGTGKYLNATSLLGKLPEGGFQVETADYDNDGDLDIFLATHAGTIHLLRNDGGNVNNYIVVKLAGLRTGSSKNNFFGIGAKVEVKAGNLYQMQVMSDPLAHFGIGNREKADVVRVVWSNGVPQNRFNPERNQTMVENQILKGSCPWLFTWNGKKYQFVTDVLWTSALGMPLGIMGGKMGYAFANSSNDYMKIPGEKLHTKNGKYSLQFTSELWETSYVDQVKLLVVDHPENVDIFVDEKFTPPPYPPLRIYAVANKRRPVSARDGLGNDVLKEIARQDREYLSNLTPTRFQGLMEPHDLILDLGNLSQTDSIFLFLQGWIFPTDASINVNLSQSSQINSTPPYLQVIDENGNWKTVIKSLGFPKGKDKTVVTDLSGKFLVDVYRIRIRTNMQIYWDNVFFTTEAGGSPLLNIPLEPVTADIHYRGFSEVSRKTPYSPHLPDYQSVTKEPKWRDLSGLYTRYGKVLPLLLASDSKYVIMNSGDELTIEFDAAQVPELPDGWSRDFLFFNNGWVKDGDLNTAHGQTVKPLPFQDMTAYPYSPDESYPHDKEHQAYLRTYNNRKITTESFKRFLFDIKTK